MGWLLFIVGIFLVVVSALAMFGNKTKEGQNEPSRKQLRTMLFIGVLLAARGWGAVHPQPEKATAPSAASTPIADTSAESPKSQPSGTPPKAQTQEQPQEQNQEQPAEPALPGITSADIKLNLKQWGLSFSGPDRSMDRGKATDPDTLVELRADLSGKRLPFEVRSVTFTVDGTSVAGILDPDTYLAVAEGYLGYCATLPYDGAEQEAAREWVIAHIPNANRPENAVVKQFGPAEYSLFGGKYMRVLQITAKAG